jgi:Zn finger protein HypA/HybF involved in hydrogenase expression
MIFNQQAINVTCQKCKVTYTIIKENKDSQTQRLYKYRICPNCWNTTLNMDSINDIEFEVISKN